jgi:DNA-binding NtrC family response regulator
MATVLIIAADRVIGDLLGQLADLVGHAVQFRRETEEPAEAVRQSRADLVMVDADYGKATARAADAATELGVPIVYFATSVPASELRRFAFERGARYFALPAGPKLLSRVLADALDAARRRAHRDPYSLAEYAVTAASVAVARARALADASAKLKAASRMPRAEHEAALVTSRRRYAELREAVMAYTRELRSAGVPPDRTVEKVKSAISAALADARPAPETDAIEWCLHAYYAA